MRTRPLLGAAIATWSRSCRMAWLSPTIVRVRSTRARSARFSFSSTRCRSALRAWRSEVAREHNLPAYIVFNDATLAQMAQQAPSSLDALSGISGVGAKKLEAYGREILRVLEAAGG